MGTTILYSPIVEAQALLSTLDFVSVGMFKSLNMNVLPFEAKNRQHPYGIIVPKLPYYKWPGILLALSKHSNASSSTSFLHYRPAELEQVIKEIQTSLGNNVRSKLIEKELCAVIRDIQVDLASIFGRVVFSDLKIYLTRFGIGTKNLPVSKIPARLKICVREGATVTNVVAAVIDSLTHIKKTELKLESHELRPIRDWLITNSCIAKTLSKHKLKYIPSTTYTRKKTTDSYNKSNTAYVAELGLFLDTLAFTVNDSTVVFNGTALNGLTNNEQEVLTKLVQKKNNVVSFEEILEVLENSDKILSFYSAYKIIERLRKKFVSLGVPSNLIKTVPKQGVVLISQ
jgi:hypothetical protein